jgi:ribA/ribD-fused uncharacterized protein
MATKTKIDVTETRDFVFFWGGWPSQWHRCQFTVDGVTYNCAEQYMMAAKAKLFGDAETMALILASTNPRQQKALGRKVQNFDAATWDRECREAVYRGNLAKFDQNPDLRSLLLATGTKRIVEASPTDRIWGIGLAADDPRSLDPSQWRGTNWLGESLGRVRDVLNKPV